MDVFILTNHVPDWNAPPAAPVSVHSTLEGAKRAFRDGKYVDSWRKTGERSWVGPDGFGGIIQFEVKEE